jgi:ribosomal-protein-alanine N-acetyltransferase
MIRLMRSSIVVRPAVPTDAAALGRLLLRADCLYPAGSSLTAGTLLGYPLTYTAWQGKALRGCLGLTELRPSTARIHAVAVDHRRDVDECLRELLGAVEAELREGCTNAIIYFGQDPWLIRALKDQGCVEANSILRFQKRGWEVPIGCNEEVRVRPATQEDIPALVRLDRVAFQEDMWRNGTDSFRHCLNRMALFVVAETQGRMVGYQFSYIEEGEGYVARVAVHPRSQNQRIGSRLLVEAIRFFRMRGVRNIVLNTQNDNHKAQRLYRRFGFRLAGEEALVLRRRIEPEGIED